MAKGFTLIETMIVVATLALLASSVVIVVDPAARFEDARDSQREIHVQSILSAIEQKRTVERGWTVTEDCEEIPHEIDEDDYPVFEEIGRDYYDLYSCLVPDYLPQEYYEPREGDSDNTGYEVWKNPFSGRVTVRYQDDDKEIVAGPEEYWVLGIPMVETDEPYDIGFEDAKAGGEVLHDGDSAVFERGVTWGTEPEPEISGNRSLDGSGLGTFESEMTEMEPDTDYYMRAYGRNEVGVGYGDEEEFRTFSLEPGVETLPPSHVGNDVATIEGEVLSPGITTPQVYLQWGETDSLGNEISFGEGERGVYSEEITHLELGETYYYRIMAENTEGASYGDIEEFTTELSEPAVNTVSVSATGGYTANLEGEVYSRGGLQVTERGFCYNTYGSPDMSDECVQDQQGELGFFEENIEELDANTTYYVRAYAENSEGIGYGEELSFTTDMTPPEIETEEPYNVTGDTADSGGDVYYTGGGTIVDRGVCWSRLGTPTVDDDCTHDGIGAGVFESRITGLIGGETYNVRAFAENEEHLTYGDELDFLTESTPPHVTTKDATGVGATSALSGGEVELTGGEEVTARGVCYNTVGSPTIDDDCTEDGSGLGEFDSILEDLSPGTTYYARAYGENIEGAGYGEQISFTTDITAVTVETFEVTDIYHDTAVSGGEVTDDGGGDVTERGVCYGMSSSPVLDDTCTHDGQGVGTFESELTGLIGGETYYVRAYATNQVGTVYGEEVDFVTDTGPPYVETKSARNITTDSADSGGDVTFDGGAEVTERGICYNTMGSPTQYDDCIEDESGGLGEFDISLSGLDLGTTYYVRAYATNSIGTQYGSQISFTTDAEEPHVETVELLEARHDSATVLGEVIDERGADVVDRGTCWSVNTNPTIDNNCTNDGMGLGEFESELTDLDMHQQYYARAYATNNAGTSYGGQVEFITGVVEPIVETTPVTDIGLYDATTGGNVVDHGGADIVDRGVCYNTYGSPDIGDACTHDGAGMGDFESYLEGLDPGIEYYVRAFAENEGGEIGYGDTETFQTEDPDRPEVTTVGYEDVRYSSALALGEVTDDGGDHNTERGFCYDTSSDPFYGINDCVVDDGTGEGAFETIIEGLDTGVTYYFRAYAVNAYGEVVYGSNRTFTTRVIVPEVETEDITDIDENSASSGGEITDYGGGEITRKGVCWSTDPEPTTGDDCTNDGEGTDAFVSEMTGLDPATEYHVRAYARNSAGDGYGEEKTFTTDALLSVEKEGGGEGFITSDPGDIECGDICQSVFTAGTVVVLTADADEGFAVLWEECPEGEIDGNQCEVIMDDNRTVIASFLIKDDYSIQTQGQFDDGTYDGTIAEDGRLRLEFRDTDFGS